MRLKFAFSFLVLATTAILIACNGTDKTANSNSQKPAGTEVTYADGARRITIDQLDAMVKNGEAYIVDVRNQASYDIGHIPGSRLIPAGEIANHISELPRDKTIVTYCSWKDEHTSAGAVVTLKSKGIENAAALLGGFNLWQQQGRPIDKKQ